MALASSSVELLRQEQADDFANELIWCIKQLETGLQRQSPSSKQAQEAMKMIKILRSTKAPMVKKRQVMRSALGDYRKKMREGEKKSFKAMKHSRFQSSANCMGHSKSRFLRQSHAKQDLHSYSTGCVPIATLSKLSLGAQQDSDSLETQALAVSNEPLTVKKGNGVVAVTQNDLAESSPIGKDMTTDGGDDICHTHENLMFKFVPSDNSFLFGFPEDESENNSKHISCNEDIDESIQMPTADNTAEPHLSDNTDVQKNYFKYEKSDNDFAFGFGN